MSTEIQLDKRVKVLETELDRLNRICHAQLGFSEALQELLNLEIKALKARLNCIELDS